MTKGYIPASDFHVFRCFGNDAESFLQSQFTGDVSTIPDGGWALSGYCSPKGRLLAVFFVCRAESEFLLLTHDSVSDAVIARLRMYVMRADVTFERLAEPFGTKDRTWISRQLTLAHYSTSRIFWMFRLLKRPL